MRILFIDTSSYDVSIAIVNDGKIISSINKNIPNEHSVYTVSFLDEVIRQSCLKVSDIDKILVVTGPGSFTGVRIGVTIAKTYAYLRKIDIIEVSSLKMLALSLEHDYCLALIDARHGNYYVGLYDSNNNEVINEQFSNKDEILKLISKYNPTIVSNEDIMFGDIKIEKQKIDIVNVCFYYKDVMSSNPHLVVPNYLKLPQALEEKK